MLFHGEWGVGDVDTLAICCFMGECGVVDVDTLAMCCFMGSAEWEMLIP